MYWPISISYASSHASYASSHKSVLHASYFTVLVQFDSSASRYAKIAYLKILCDDVSGLLFT